MWRPKYLILGSGPDMPRWWAFHGRRFDGWRVCCINNAWMLCPERVDEWYRSTDYATVGNARVPRPVARLARWRFARRSPFWYRDFRGGTMLLNVLFHLLNQCRTARPLIAVAGCDLVYPQGRSHFYGNGAPDPLRFGEEWLASELTGLVNDAASIGARIVNVGMAAETRLPFRRVRRLAPER